ncbi:M6 family metalloprotease domain-containing protein [Streptomyces sp. XD-27]|uniref:M6 family metalloprotease domain-containing protein n=1 Tax=Streptomyces sp. XD-27 TaxID=3062779 RepID=UPI0026F439E7|nr:M6 family metalloprotease domain-containing protein [Streptomyces sp. XD-27]WKX70478.1 M6 family metalloprotease domain-containing protein [Streptomyces sp. XD-27]
MERPQIPERVARPPWPRRAGSVLTSLTALIATTVISGPAAAADPGGPCVLARGDVHHSEGLDTWNTGYPRPTRTLDAVMIFLSFPDAEPYTTPDELVADHFPDTSDFFRRASYGQFDLRVHPMRRWTAMPEESTSYAIQRDWDPAHRTAYLRDAVAAADPAVDFARYDIVYLVADPDAPGIDADATKVVNFDQPLHADGTPLRRLVTVFENHPPDLHVLAHETGHVFDLPDLYRRPTDGGDDWDTRVGDWDLMGSQFGLAPDPFGWHKWKLGWLRGRQVTCLRNPRRTVHSLAPIGAPAPRGAPGADLRTRLVVIRTGPAEVLAIEARGAFGNDAGICAEGVLVYRVRSDIASGDGPIEVLDAHPGSEACHGESVYPKLADAPLGVGEALDIDPGGLRVQVRERTADGVWTVRITSGKQS